MLAALNGAGFTYLSEKQTITSQLINFHAADSKAFFLTISIVFISGLGSLLGAVHLTSPKNSIRSLPTRIGIFVLYCYAAIWFFVYAPSLLKMGEDRDFLILAFFAGMLLIPLLRINFFKIKIFGEILKFTGAFVFKYQPQIKYCPLAAFNISKLEHGKWLYRDT